MKHETWNQSIYNIAVGGHSWFAFECWLGDTKSITQRTNMD